MIPKRFITFCLCTIFLSVNIAYGSEGDLRHGKNVEVRGTVIYIDSSFLNGIIQKPDFEEWSGNYFELIYLVTIEHKKAMKAAFYLMTSKNFKRTPSLSESVDYDLADKLFTTHTFWKELSKLEPALIQAVLSYYEENKPYARGTSYEKEKARVLSTND